MPIRANCRRIVWLIMCLLVCGSAVAAGPSQDERYLAGLRERRLWSLAEALCHHELDRSGLSDERRAALTIELSQTCIEHALEAAPNERGRLWHQAADVLEQFFQRDPTSHRHVLVEVQAALVRLAQGELARQEEQITGDPAGLEQARVLLRDGIARLRGAQKEIDEQSRRLNAAPVREIGMLSASELTALRRNVQFQLAKALANQGETYPAGSADRTSALAQALELARPLAASDADDALAWHSRVLEIECSRLLNDFEAAARRLTLVSQRNPPGQFAAAVRAEALRLALARNQLAQAIALAPEAGDSAPTSIELEYASLETCLAAARADAAASKTKEAAVWQKRASDLVEQIERRYGQGRARRAELLLAGQVADAPASDDLSVLLRAAEGLYRAGRSDDAVAAFDRAAIEAEAAGQPGRSFAAAFTAAAIEQDRKKYSQAAERFLRLARHMPDEAKASQAHLLACFNTAQLWAAGSTKAGEDYLRLLAEHLKLWPRNPTSDQARLWLGRVYEQRRQTAEAIAVYQEIRADSPQFASAVDALGRVMLDRLRKARASGQPTDVLAAGASRWFEAVVSAPARSAGDSWTDAQRLAGLAAARIEFEFGSQSAEHVRELLGAALGAGGEVSPAWRAEAQALQVAVEAAAGRYDEAQAAIDKLSGAGVEAGLELIADLEQLARRQVPEQRPALAELILRAARLLEARPLSADGRRTVRLAMADALTWKKEPAQARQLLESMAQAAPQDAEVQEAYAQSLAAAGDPDSLHQALERWRSLEQGSRPGSARWFKAKYELAAVHERLGNFERALKIVQLTALLHPDLGGDELRPKFEALAERCRQGK